VKKTFVLLLVVILLSTAHRLYAPIVIYASRNAPVISGGTVIVSGSASPPSATLWTLQQSSDLSSGIWLRTSQQPIYNGTSFSCTNTPVASPMFYRMKYGLNGPPVAVVPATGGP
jgi:hypothetical protein